MPRTIGHYEVLKELGRGHYGTVYLARGEIPGRHGAGRRRLVAIKQLRDPGDAEARDTLLQEFELLDQVHHRSLCKVYEFLEDEDAIVMEAVHGVTLRAVIEACAANHVSVLTEAAIDIGCELADCLYQAWATPGRGGEPLQLVHRDLKPENVMLTPDGQVKILDFGLARAHHGRIAEDGAKGTVLYMAPEQARGEAVDHRTDLFAVGLILYELLMGAPAYDLVGSTESSVDHLMDRIDAADLGTQVAALESKLPDVGRIVGRCLRPERRHRYETGHELLLDLSSQLYKDRGATLREFCDYLFSTLIRLDPLEPPRTETPRPSSSRRSPEPSRGDAMSKDKKPPRPSGPPRPGRAGPPRPGRAGPPRPGGPPSAPVRPPTSAAGPPRGGPSFSPEGGPPGGLKRRTPTPKKPDGPKRPDATGMLEMVPLSGEDEEELDERKKSATQFFAIPGAKKPAPPPPQPTPDPGGAAGRSMPQGPAPSMAPIASPGVSAGGVVPPPMVGHGGSMPPVMGGISGPIASGPVAAGPTGASLSPFQVSDQVGPPPGDSENRARSWRIYAILLALIGLVFTVAAVGVVAVVVGVARSGADDTETVVAPPSPSPTPRPARTEDTGVPAPLPPAPQYVAPQSRPRPSSGGSAAPRPAPRPSTAPVTVTIPPTARYPGGIEITCPSGFRQRGAFSGQTATVQDVPTESCTLHFKGGSPAQYSPVSGGHSYSCEFPATGVASCR